MMQKQTEIAQISSGNTFAEVETTTAPKHIPSTTQTEKEPLYKESDLKTILIVSGNRKSRDSTAT